MANGKKVPIVNMATVDYIGKTAPIMSVALKITVSKAKEKCTFSAATRTKALLLTARRRVKASTHLLTVAATTGPGATICSTVRAHLDMLTAQLALACGLKTNR